MGDKRRINFIYRQFDANNVLLYVGVTKKLSSRMHSHLRRSKWRKEITKIELAMFQSREEVYAAERQAIKNEHPKYNIRYRYRPPRAAIYRGLMLNDMTAVYADSLLARFNGGLDPEPFRAAI